MRARTTGIGTAVARTWIALALIVGVIVGQDRQMVVIGTLRIDGSIPSGFQKVNVYRQDSITVREIISIDTLTATFGVSIFASDGFAEGDVIQFRAFANGQSFMLRAKDGPVLFHGATLDPPLPPEVVNVKFFRNHPPGSFGLQEPPNQDTLRSTVHSSVRFTWQRSTDIDWMDTLVYVLHLRGPDVDTSFLSKRDTTLLVAGIKTFGSDAKFTWWVEASDGFTTTICRDTFAFQFSHFIDGVADASWIGPVSPVLLQNYPNPFNPTTVIQYTVAAPSDGRSPKLVDGSKAGAEGPIRVRLSVFDLLGREVAVLVNETKPPGTYAATWNASNYSSGVYLCRLTVGLFTTTKKMLVAK